MKVCQLIVVLVVAGLTGCLDSGRFAHVRLSEAPPTAPSVDEVAQHLVGTPAVEAFRLNYWQAAEHKAFASSEDGVWGWSAGSSRIQQVRDLAWSNCQHHVRRHLRPCRIVNLDGAWQTSSSATAMAGDSEQLDPYRWMSALSLHEWELYCSRINDLAQSVLPRSDSCPSGFLGSRSPMFSCVPGSVLPECHATVEQTMHCTQSFFELLTKNWCDLQQRQFEGLMRDFARDSDCYSLLESCSPQFANEVPRAP